MLSHPESRIANRRRASPLRTLSLAALTLFVSASMAAAQGGGGGGGMCQGGGGGGAGGSAGGGTGGAGGISASSFSRGQQGGGSGGQIDTTSLTASLSSMSNKAAVAGAQMRQAQQAQIDYMAKVRRDVQQAAQQRVQQRDVALEARLVREERLAESAAKAKAIRIASAKKLKSSASSLIASTDQPTTSKLSSDR